MLITYVAIIYYVTWIREQYQIFGQYSSTLILHVMTSYKYMYIEALVVKCAGIVVHFDYGTDICQIEGTELL